MILPMTNPPTHRTAPTHEYNFSPFCLSPAEIVRSYVCGRQFETLRRKEFLKLRLPPYVTPGEKENKIEKSENRKNQKIAWTCEQLYPPLSL